MHPAISINTLCLPPAPLGEQVERIARIGAGGISPELDQVLAFGVAESARAFREAGLAVATLTHRAFGYATPAETDAARERLLRTIGIARDVGAATVIMTTGGRGDLNWPTAAARFADAMAPCAEAARAAGLRLGIEPTSHLYADVSIAHRLADTLALARGAGIAVMIDLFACWTDADIEAVIAEAGADVALVQVADYVYGDRGLPCRAVPGDGAVPLDRLIPAISRSGFTGWYDLEVIGPRLAAEGVEAGLRRAAEHVGQFLETAR
ncbi:sugar phosphate isomerase/epimerase family protein [Novosphingobium sp. JCM 18896]|uniref:sugar phosphate isomerase/epimerase family protein n=1 Tax=Novosphingobium sp. JCM 18896 TaxID=2989731 RepID=UPI0022226AC8|nr:sugar phosphate isomerase/epimerase [Novosphingobium sp. JCM 18896]MCW1428367.1 sugar phosphate isomerase/epimerase [Novosphingobium sp. JCM 18896]